VEKPALSHLLRGLFTHPAFSLGNFNSGMRCGRLKFNEDYVQNVTNVQF